MREEIDGWVAEGRSGPHTDRPLVLMDVPGVVADATVSGETEGAGREEPVIPSHMPALVRHLVEVAEVCWSTPLDEELNVELAERLGVDPLPCIEADEYGMTEPAARELLWKAASAGRPTFRIENVSSEIPSRLPDSTVLVNISPDKVLRSEHLPPVLRPA
jgi:hypothetical protein